MRLFLDRLYSAPLWILFALAVQCCHSRRWPLPPCFALLWVGAEQWQGLFLISVVRDRSTADHGRVAVIMQSVILRKCYSYPHETVH